MSEEKNTKSTDKFRRTIDKVVGGLIGFTIGAVATVWTIYHNNQYDYSRNINQQEPKNSIYYSQDTSEFTIVKVKHPEGYVQLSNIPKGNSIIIFPKSYYKESWHDTLLLEAIDYNKDGDFDLIYKETNSNERINELANFDSVKSIYRKVNNEHMQELFMDNYEEELEAASEMYNFDIDTLVRTEFGELYGLTDLSKDGTYDMIQWVGRTPGAYSITLSEDLIDDALRANRTYSVPLGSRVEVKSHADFNNSLDILINKK